MQWVALAVCLLVLAGGYIYADVRDKRRRHERFMHDLRYRGRHRKR